ncbi:hypothetical protein CWE21_00100 [Pseudidiomarina aquimaris]|uniref:Uncharacterized protein n=1 Tax=Pseudidiomarina aquimaris TaxID=641841 RepID=A0A432XPJ5_9GAMM|nr:hypothetical protein [Pseudidiomarina aquimaris]RUO50541.1 hypothetical protein CWE21_00100 [Pseudidiomarina aquimaris]
MIYALILIVIGIAVALSGVWEQNLFTIMLGALLEVIGWVWFFIKWRSAKKEGQLDNNEK